ncbi:MAG TPA: ABC transporter permease [Candidatus Sulfopaludibacter sp.]|jgi:putative ABC transport system permease protein|nr:ABC transporter permease [Candidatus Sulfopaludibacter sp.]
MSIPLAYNLRNLVVRKTTTLMTALGIALTVAVLLAILSLVSGLRATLSASGDPLKVLILRQGSDSELVSNFSRPQFQDLKFKPGIAAGRDGQPLASLELVTVINLASVENPNGTNVTVRGLPPSGIEMRPTVHLKTGRWFDPGRNEVVVGKLIAQRYPGARIGQKIHVGRSDWEVVGVFDAVRGAQDSEIWADLNRLSADMQRVEVLSSALVQAKDAVSAAALINDIGSDQRLGMHALTEKEYYELQTASGAPIEFVGIFVSIVMAVGSSFAAMNTMYAAVSRRAREIGTLRVLGFSRGSILLSFFIESVLLSGLGGVLGCLLVLPLNGLTTGVGTSSFSELAFDFHMTPQILMFGILFAVVLGSLGGFFPARMAANKEILTSLREV